MKFLCIDCDEVMVFAERRIPGDGTMAAVFACGACGREMAMLTNPMETQLVSSLGVKVGGREVPAQPMEGVRTSLKEGREDAFREEGEDTKEAKRSPPPAPPVVGGKPTGDPAARRPEPSSPPRPAFPKEDAPPRTPAPKGTPPPPKSGPVPHPGPVEWSPEAVERLHRVPGFVRGMVKRIYIDYARERGIRTITPQVMDTARRELGLEGM